MPSPYWGKRAGAYYSPVKPKGQTYVWGWVIKLKRRGPSVSNSARKTVHYTKLLAENARARGWMNGHRIGGKGEA